MRTLKIAVLWLIALCVTSQLLASDTIYYELWDINNLEEIGGYHVTVLGDPKIVKTELGKAIQFDGVSDQLIVDFNPIMDAKEFTVELVFKPDACYPNNTEPRFLHIQDPDDPDEKRVMIELRIDKNNQCYMDGYMKTDTESLPLKDEILVHPTKTWHHVAITYKNNILTTYFNGIEELNGLVHYSSEIISKSGKTSLGGRMTESNYYSGLMKAIKVTHAALNPSEFILINTTLDQD